MGSSWSVLPASFEAPDAAVVYSASESAVVFAEKLERIASALNTFADELGPVKSTLKAIKEDAVDFLKDFDEQHRVWVNATATKEYFGANVSGQTGSTYTSMSATSGSGGGGDGVASLTYLRGRGETARLHGGVAQIKASWLESSWHVDRNNDLLDRVADAYAKISDLEVECGDKINQERDECAAPLVAVEAWQLKQSGAGSVDLPWGHRVEEDRNCGESMWHGFSTAGLQTVQGLGSLVSYNPVKNSWGDWGNAGAAWEGTVTGLVSLVAAANPETWVLALVGVPWARDALNTTFTMGKGLVAWDEWSKNPAEALGATAFNVGTFLIPGAGAVGGGVKALTTGTKLEIIATAIGKVEAVTANLKKLLPETLAKLFDGPDTAAAAREATPDLTIHAPDSAPHINTPEPPHLPEEHAPDSLESPPVHPDGGGESGGYGDAGAHETPRGHDGGGIPDGSDGPDVRDDGSSGHDGRDTATGDSGGLGDQIASGTDPVHTGELSGPGWVREADPLATPKDVHYGEVLDQHGVSAMPERTTVNEGTFDLVEDPLAPYGRFADGTPLSQGDYDSRYVFPNGHDNYPPNAGAVRASRIVYDDYPALQRDYGAAVDRIGSDGGDYLGVRVDGARAAFEERSLPISALAKPVNDYALTGVLPKGWHVEVSEIAPGCGRPGGGLQIRFLDGFGDAVRVDRLKLEGLLS